ncbi:MAG: hypothetical protein GY903_00035, partial [Fuerstiella sp.]|nr:hypothetical protein [Fuerstiella sp.]
MTTSFANSNDAPTVANAQADFNHAEDAALDYDFAANTFTDADSGDSCTYTSTQADGSALPGWLTFTANDRNYAGTPANANVGALNVRTTCTDGSGQAVNDDFTITVTNTNDVPTSTSFTVTTAEDTEHVFTAAEFGYADVDSGDALVSATLQAASAGSLWVDDGGGGGTADDGTINGNEAVVANGDTVTAAELAKLTWDPAANQNGAGYATFTYTLNDGDGNSGSYTATLTVTAANDAPTSAAVTVAGTEDTLKTYAASNFAFSDVDSGDSISRILITIVESAGDLECNNKNGGSTGWTDCSANDYVAAGTDLRLTPASNSVADVTFSFKVYDGTAYSAAAYILTTTHAAVDDAPTTAGDTATVAEDDSGYDGWTADSDWGYSDVENTAMVKILIVTTVGAGTLAVDADAGNDCDSGEEVVAGSTEINDEHLGNLEFCPAANSVAQQTFTFKVHDGNSWSGVGTMTITITAANDAPSAGATADQTVYEDVAYSFATATSTDVDGDTLAITCLERNNAGSATSALPGWIGVSDGG